MNSTFRLPVRAVGCHVSALVLAASIGVVAPHVGRAQTGSPEAQLDSAEAALAFEAVVVNNQMLQNKLATSEAAVAALQKNLANANSEAEVFRRKASELTMRLEALGIDGVSGSSAKLEQRLLKAVSDLNVIEDERKRLQQALIQLSEAVLHYQKVTVSTDPEARLALETEMRVAAKALGVAPPESVEGVAVSSTLGDGMVISIKDELALIVANVGSRQGVKVGMPFQVRRGDAMIGTVRVVDVRDKIAGAVIQDLNSDTNRIKVGDRLKVDARE